MANIDAPFGLRPIKHRSGAPYNGACNAYYVPSSYGTALFVGDCVVKTGTSNAAVVNGNPIASLPEVNRVAAGDGNAITGVIVGFQPVGTNEARNYNPASTAAVVYVADDPDLVFVAQADSAGALTADSIGLNAVLIYTHSGNTTTGFSGAEIDTTSDVPAADASNQLTLLRLHSVTGNELGTHAIFEVSINNHTEVSGAIGI